jgi:UDP:flavonoid glycosyltransferase YjiC (YdhE family)
MSRARIDLATPPFAGHLHPLLGIGRRLARDHDVRVISTESAQRAIAAAGLEGVALLPGRDAEVWRIADGPRAVRSNPVLLHAQLRANLALLESFQIQIRELWEEERPDLLIADFTLPVAGSVARQLGIPWWTCHSSPCVIETPDGPPAYLGGWSPGKGPLGRLRDTAGRALIRGFKVAVHRLYRRQMVRLGVPAIYRPDGSEAVYSDERLLAFGVPGLEFPRRWPAAVELVGPVLYTPPRASGDAPEIPFAHGRRHVLVTLGTHLGWRKEAMADSVRQAARALPDLEFHFSDGDARSGRHESIGNFHRLGYVPYATHLPRYALIVHHGGTGVMYHTLSAGKPALVFPVDFDQFDHAARLTAAGLAHRLERPSGLARQVASALADRRLLAACRRFQAVLAGIQAEERVSELVAEKTGRKGTAETAGTPGPAKDGSSKGVQCAAP